MSSKEEKSPFIRGIIIVIALIAVIAIAIFAVDKISYYKKLKERSLTDEEIKEIFVELIPNAEKVNEIIWGEGLAVSPDADGLMETQTGAQYRRVADDCEYKSIDEIKSAISEVYSSDFIEKTINIVAFEGNTDEDEPEVASSTIYPRYKETKDEDGNTQLNIDIAYNKFTFVTEYDAESAEFSENVLVKKGLVWQIDKIKCTVKAKVDGKDTEITLTIVNDENGYRLDEPTY